MLCTCCGFDNSTTLKLSESEDRAIASLTRQAREQGGDLGKLLRSIRDRMKVQGRATRGLDRALEQLFKRVIEDVMSAANGGNSTRAALKNLTREQLGSMLDAAGLDDIINEWTEAQSRLITAAQDSADLAGVPAGQVAPRSSAIGAWLDAEADELWDDKIRRPAVRTIREGLLTMGDTPEDLVPRLQRKLDLTRSQAATEARTRIADFDQFVVDQNSDAQLWWYAGPDDNITRPFCDEIVGKVFDSEQVDALDNSQTIISPRISRGGYNCRHRWVPMSETTFEASGLPRGTDADVRSANAVAK